jgi:hypothetical protein
VQSKFKTSVQRIAIACSIAIPSLAAITFVMFVVPPIVCYGSLFAGLALFIVGSDLCILSKPLTAIGGIIMFAAVFAAAIRGLLG